MQVQHLRDRAKEAEQRALAVEETANRKMHEANEQAKVANRKIADAESKAAAAKELTLSAKREFERAEELKRHAQEELTNVQQQEAAFIHKQQNMRHLETKYKSELATMEAQKSAYEQQKSHLHQMEANVKEMQARHHKQAEADHRRLAVRESELDDMLQEIEAKRHQLSDEEVEHQVRVIVACVLDSDDMPNTSHCYIILTRRFAPWLTAPRSGESSRRVCIGQRRYAQYFTLLHYSNSSLRSLARLSLLGSFFAPRLTARRRGTSPTNSAKSTKRSRTSPGRGRKSMLTSPVESRTSRGKRGP